MEARPQGAPPYHGDLGRLSRNSQRPMGEVTNGPAEHRVTRLELVEQLANRRRPHEVERHVAVHAGQCSQMWRQRDPYHDSVCTSTQ